MHKSIDFNTALEGQGLEDMEWKLRNALSAAMRSILEDNELDNESKIKQISDTLDQYKISMVVWITKLLALRANTKSNGVELETKVGKKISKVRMDTLRQIHESSKSMSEMLEEFINEVIGEENNTEEEVDETKKCKPKNFDNIIEEIKGLKINAKDTGANFQNFISEMQKYKK